MRDGIIIFVSIILAMMVGSYLFFNGKPSLPPAGNPVFAPEESFGVLAEGQDAGQVTRRTNFRIQTEEEFIELWSMIYGTGGPARPLVNFERYEVIAVFDGTHSSGGYDVEVTDVTEDAGRQVIHIRREVPGDECIVPDAITSPFQMVRVEKSMLPLGKEETVVTAKCR